MVGFSRRTMRSLYGNLDYTGDYMMHLGESRHRCGLRDLAGGKIWIGQSNLFSRHQDIMGMHTVIILSKEYLEVVTIVRDSIVYFLPEE